MRKLVMCIGAGLVGLVNAQTNLISNSGFESGNLSGWEFEINAPATTADGSARVVTTQAHTGTSAAEVVVNKAFDASKNWYIQLKFPKWDVQPNSRYKISFWAKGPATTIHTGFLDVPNDYAYLGGINTVLTSEWTQYTGELVTSTQSGTDLAIGFYVAGTKGTYYFDDASVTMMPPLDTAWYGQHPSRIDSLRKKEFSVAIRDSLDQAIPNASVRLKLKRHSYPFGSALAFQNTANPTGDELWYRQTAAEMFNSAVFENDFKWPTFEIKQNKPDTAKIAKYLNWGDSVGIPFRGHALVWAIQNYGYQTFWGTDTAKLSCSEIAANIKSHITRDMTYYKGRITEYDVWNEAIHEPAFFVKCKDDPKYAPNGWALQDSAFVWARAADPTAKLYINEYNNVDGGETESYYEMIKAMLERGTPIDGIGIQCHFGGKKIDPADVKSKLDRLASLGLPIKVTEFDNERMSGAAAFTPSQQALQFNRFVRLMYSHPAVEGIMLWGFWDSRQWLSQMNPAVSPGIYTKAKVAKPAVDSLKYLWNTLWTTDTTLLSDSKGDARLRGFPGKYEAVVTIGDKQWTLPVDFSSNVSTSLKITGTGTVGVPLRQNQRSLALRAVLGGIEVSHPQSASVSNIWIASIDGRRVREVALKSGTTKTLIQLKPGTYFVRLRSSESEVTHSITVLH